jgi:hypothetical protein
MRGSKNTGAVPPPATPMGGVHEPGPDWVPLALAPFHYYGERGYIRTEQEMREAFLRFVESSIIVPPPVPPEGVKPKLLDATKVEWSVNWLPRRGPVISREMALSAIIVSRCFSIGKIMGSRQRLCTAAPRRLPSHRNR